jgi:two-component sensor histidine kinase
MMGPPLVLTPVAAQNIGLALHELATNAARYGALSVPDGRVVFDWTVKPQKPELLQVSWKEENCPPG